MSIFAYAAGCGLVVGILFLMARRVRAYHEKNFNRWQQTSLSAYFLEEL